MAGGAKLYVQQSALGFKERDRLHRAPCPWPDAAQQETLKILNRMIHPKIHLFLPFRPETLPSEPDSSESSSLQPDR